MSAEPGQAPSDAASWRNRANFAFEKDERWTQVDEYNVSHLHAADRKPAPELLARVQASSDAAGMPAVAVSAAHGKFLQIQARLVRARTIVEVGMLGGYSTIWLASSHGEARVTSIEIDEEFAAKAREHFEWAGVAGQVEVRVGSGMDELPKLVEEVREGKRPKVDLAFIDANKENNLDYFNYVMEMAHPGTCIIVDNVVRRGAVVNPAMKNDLRVAGARRVIEGVGKDKRVEATVLQMVGDKTYDGFLTAVVLE
jgi:predicted O-methyltransferase YrrM